MTAPGSALTAFFAAIPTALGLWIAALYAYTHILSGPGIAAARLPYMIMGGVLFGVPLLVAVVLCIAWPAHLVLQRTIGVSLPVALVTGAVCGVTGHVAVGALWGQPELGFVPLPVAIAKGVGTAWVWWRVWSRPPVSSRAHRGAI
jgi:hypothetical protein